MDPDTSSHYRRLGLTPPTTEPELQAAYRRLALLHHPDRQNHHPSRTSSHPQTPTTNTPDKNFKLVCESYNILLTQLRRARTRNIHGVPYVRRSRGSGAGGGAMVAMVGVPVLVAFGVGCALMAREVGGGRRGGEREKGRRVVGEVRRVYHRKAGKGMMGGSSGSSSSSSSREERKGFG